MIVSPITGSTNVRRLRSIPTSPLIDEWMRVFGIDIGAHLRGVAALEHYRCEDSRVEFFMPPQVAGSPRLYEELQRLDWYYASHVWELDLALEDLRGCRRVVEIGAGSGGFVERARAVGIEMIGLETNPAACRAARQRGIPIECTDLQEYLRQAPRGIDALCAFQVLEHLADPRSFLETCAGALPAGGRLLLSVPNANGYLRHLDDPLDRPPHHMTRWPHEAFRRLDRFVPFRLESLVVQPLAPSQIRAFLATHSLRHRRWGILGRLAFNRLSVRLFERALRAGLRSLFAGHTVYVRLRRSPAHDATSLLSRHHET